MHHVRRLTVLLALLPLGLAASGCGQQQAAGLAPADAALYGEIRLDLEGDQERNWQAILKRFPEIGDPDTRIGELFARASRSGEVKIDYAKDVQPWLGDRAGFFLGVSKDKQAAAAALIAATDEGKAQDFVDKNFNEGGVKREYEGQEYLFKDRAAAAVFEGNLVIGTEAGVKAAVDAEKGEALSEADRFEDRIEALPEERAAEFYVDYGRLFDVAAATGGAAAGGTQALKRALGPTGEQPVALAAVLEDDGLAIEGDLPAGADLFSSPLFGAGTGLIGDLPADAFFALAQPEFGKTLSRLIDAFSGQVGGRDQVKQLVERETGLDLDKDILGWMGDVGIFARGTDRDELGGGLVVKSKDPATSKRTLETLRKVAARQARASGGAGAVGGPKVRGAEAGFTVDQRGVPEAIHVVQRGDKVVGAYGQDAAELALEPRQRLADAPDFKAAAADLGEGFALSNYVTVDPIVRLAAAFGAARSPQFAEFQEYAKRFRFVVAGTRKDGDRLTSRVELVLR